MTRTPRRAGTAGGIVRHPLRTMMRPAGVEPHRGDSRVSAFVYGDVLVLAATAGSSTGAVRSGEAVVIVLGTVVSTYVAHVLADVVGSVFSGHGITAALAAELRDSLPVASAGAPSCALLGAAALGWPSPVVAQVLASVILIVRLGSLGFVYRRLRGPVATGRALLLGAAVAAVAVVAVVVKLTLTH